MLFRCAELLRIKSSFTTASRFRSQTLNPIGPPMSPQFEGGMKHTIFFTNNLFRKHSFKYWNSRLWPIQLYWKKLLLNEQSRIEWFKFFKILDFPLGNLMVKKGRKMWNICSTGTCKISITNLDLFFLSFLASSSSLQFSTHILLLLLSRFWGLIFSYCAWFSRLSNDNVASQYDDRLDKSPGESSAGSIAGQSSRQPR